MKSVTIRLPDVEAAMLVEVQKNIKCTKSLQVAICKAIRSCYEQLT